MLRVYPKNLEEVLGIAEFEYESRICPHPSPLPKERGHEVSGSLLPREKGWG
jgi:hypothetical protein